MRADDVAKANGWDVVVWFNVLTIPSTPSCNAFYRELETWLFQHFQGAAGRVVPEWSKGFAFTDEGPWRDEAVLEKFRQTFSPAGAGGTFAEAAATLRMYDQSNLFTNAFLDRLFGVRAPQRPVGIPPRSTQPHLDVLVHLAGVGDKQFHDGELAGTTGQSRRLEGFQLTLTPPIAGLGIQYSAHVAGIGDTTFVEGGHYVGTRGQSKAIEGFSIRLTGAEAAHYELTYSAHLAGKGDTGFKANGEFCGTKGESRAVEAITVRLRRR